MSCRNELYGRKLISLYVLDDAKFVARIAFALAANLFTLDHATDPLRHDVCKGVALALRIARVDMHAEKQEMLVSSLDEGLRRKAKNCPRQPD